MAIGPRRGWLLALLTAVVSLALLEVASLVLLSVQSGRLGLWSLLQAERRAVSEETGEPGAANPFEEGLRETIVHPYLGYVQSLDAGEGFDPEALAYGFAQNTGIFFEPSPDRVVVAVLGGSVARWLALSGEDLSSALESTPRFRGREVVVVSLAMGGYKAPQQVMVLNYFLSLGAHFDVVINLDGVNELALPWERNIPHGVHPLYPQRWDLRTGQLDLETRRRIGEITHLREQRRAAAVFFSEGLWPYSFAGNLVWRLADGYWQRNLSRAQQALAAGTGEHEHDPASQGPPWTAGDRAATTRELVAAWRRSSRQLSALCRGLGIEYHHFLQPNQYVPDSKPLSAEERKEAFSRYHPFRKPVEQGYPLLQEAGRQLRAEQVAFHDLTRIFAENPETLYRDKCCHLNERGNALLAGAIAAAIGGESR